MVGTIQHRRGLEQNLPTLKPGEIAFTTDTKKVFIGSDAGNIDIISNVDTSKFASKETTDILAEALAERPKTINGKVPDSNGDIHIDVPEVDTSNLRLKTEKVEPEDASERLLALVTGQGTINLESIPQQNSVDATRLEPSLRNGLTFPLNNLIINGDFATVSSWSFSSHLMGAGYSLSSPDQGIIGNRAAKGVVAGSSESAQCRNNDAYTFVGGRKYYVSAYIKPKYNTKTQIEIGNGAEVPSNLYDVGSLTPNVWNRISGIIEYKMTTSTPKRFGINHSTSTTNTSYVNGDIVYFDGFMVIDLTGTFGDGYEPTLAEMNALLEPIPNGWFSGEARLPFSTRHNMKINTLETKMNDGLTIPFNNLVANGKFQTPGGWSLSSQFTGVGYSLSTAEDGYMSSRAAKGVIVGSSELASLRDNNVHKWEVGHKYYLFGCIKPKYNSKTSLGIGNKDEAPGNYLNFTSLTPNEWNKLSGIVKYISTPGAPDRFAIYHSTLTTDTPYVNGDVVFFDEFLAIDLTHMFGVNFEPEKEEMDYLIDTMEKNPTNVLSTNSRISLLTWQTIKLKYLQAQIDAIVGGL